MIHHAPKKVKQKIRAYWPIVAFTVPLGGRPQGPKNWAIIGTKKHAIKVAKNMQVLLQKNCKISCKILSQSTLTLQALLQTVCKKSCNNVHNIG
jgi:hypothetical protein